MNRKTFTLIAGLAGILLQLYLFVCGCSPPPNSGSPVSSAKTLYAAKCASCHRLLQPQDYTVDTWRHYVDKYGKKITNFEKRLIFDLCIVAD